MNGWRAPGESGDISDVRDSTAPGTDIARACDGDRAFNADGAQPPTTPVLVAVSPSPTAGVQEVMAGERVEE